MKRFLKDLLESKAGSLFSAARSLKNRRYFRKRFAHFQADFKKRLFPNDTPIVVQSGPFKGTHYFNEIVWGSITPKWLGSYESELHPIVTQIIGHGYETIIDVGCAEGYYAVGLASTIPSAKVFVFDTDFISRRQLRRLASLNETEGRIQIGSFCQHSDLDALATASTLVVCDIEGFEKQLLDPAKAPSLRRCDILVEVHESAKDSRIMEKLLVERFRASHAIRLIAAEDRLAWVALHQSEMPQGMPADLLLRATEEDRDAGFAWLWMRAEKNEPTRDHKLP